MATNSNIEWTHHTANLWQGCTRVHAGCDNCYAARLSARWGNELWDKLEDGTPAPRMHIKAGWNSFQKWNAAAEAAGEYHRVFVGSMMDIFEKPMPLVDSKGGKLPLSVMRDRGKDADFNTGDSRRLFFNQVVPNHAHLLFLLLTKRPSNINKMIPEAWKSDPPRNVMFGASVVDKQSLWQVGRQLSQVNGQTFLSVEPLLEELDIFDFFNVYESGEGWLPDWVIVGGESGPNRRPFDPEWARTIMDACEIYDVPFFMKQWDKVKEVPKDLQRREFPEWHTFEKPVAEAAD